MLMKALFENESLSLEEEGGGQSVDDRIQALIDLKGTEDEGFNGVNWNIAIRHVEDNDKREEAAGLYAVLSEAQQSAVAKAIKEGPLDAGDVGDAMDRLLELGMLVKVASNGKGDQIAATQAAYYLYRISVGDKEDTSEDS